MNKLLQICNVASITGGTFGCVYSIAKCLPDWEHLAIAVNSGTGEVAGETSLLFPGKVIRQAPPIPQSALEEFEPDCIIFHNLHPNAMPVYLDPDTPKFYYQHSAASSCKGARNKAHIWWAVSKYLADLVGIDDRLILRQPVPIPPGCDSRIPDHRSQNTSLIIGRICTPHRDKWEPAIILPFYKFLHRQHPDVYWEFVGCPQNLREELSDAVGGQVSFHDASYTARSLMHEWDALLYYNPRLPESYGRTVCEAQRCSCIPIVSNLGGFQEQISNGVDGFLCTEHEEFSHAIKCLKDPGIREEVSARAKISGDLRGSLSSWRQSFQKWYASTLRAIVNVQRNNRAG